MLEELPNPNIFMLCEQVNTSAYRVIYALSDLLIH